MNESVRNALYMNYGRHNVNMNALNNYYNGMRIPANKLRGLITSLEKYRNQHNPSNSVKNFIKNMKEELSLTVRNEGKRALPRITRENILLGKSRLRRRFPEGTILKFSPKNIPGHITTGRRRVPFSVENLKTQKARLRPVVRKSPPKSLAATALFQAMRQGKSPNMINLPPKLVTSALKGKGRVTPANFSVGKTNLKMVREFKNYIDLVKRAREFARNSQSGDPIDDLLMQEFQTRLNSYRKKFKLRGAKNAQLLYNTILLVVSSNRPFRTPFYTMLRAEYKKYGFFKASTIAKILRTIKKTASRT